MNIKPILLAVLFLLFPSFSQIQGTSPVAPAEIKSTNPRIHDVVFHSKALGRDVHYRVLLPLHYEDGGRFPVLYLLHGLYGDYLNWDTRTRLDNYAKDRPIIIVMPDAGDSWYTNSATVAADKFEDYLAVDLIAEIDTKYRTIADRHARAVAGLSMGGYGAIKLGLKYPELFSFSGSLSGAFNAPQNLDELRPDFRAKLLEVYGDHNNRLRKANDVFESLRASRSEGTPYLYLACGTSDFFLPVNRAFVERLSSSKLAYEFHETPGGHTWQYWDDNLEALLIAVERAIAPVHPPLH